MTQLVNKSIVKAIKAIETLYNMYLKDTNNG